MSKITLNDVSTFTNDSTAVAAVNNNNNTLETAFDNTLSRDGSSPNQMAAVLDMNSNRIVNLPAPLGLSEPLRLQDAQTLNHSGTITVGNVPNGGTTGQVLSKTSNVDLATGWSTPHYLPAGGTAGQYISKVDSTDYNTTWATLPASSLPSTVVILPTLASLSSTTIGGTVQTITFLGYSTQGDIPQFTFGRVSGTPVPSLGCAQSLDGTWWRYIPSTVGIDSRVFGVKADWDNTNTQLSTGGGDTNATDNTVPLQNAIDFALMQRSSGFDSGGGCGRTVWIPKGTCMLGSRIVVHDGVTLKGAAGLYASVLKMKATFSTSSHFVRLGSEGVVNDIALSQTRASAGNLVINGIRAIGGVAYLLNKRIIAIYSTGNNSGITFTIHGTDGDGQTQTETVSGTNGSYAQSTKYFLTVDAVSSSGGITGNVTVGWQTVASFNSRIEDLQLWSSNMNAVFGTAMVYTNNAQHTGGVSRLQIFAGNRSALFFEGGIGGASTVTVEDVCCLNHGNESGVASNNPCVYVNYAGLNFPMKRIVINGTPANGTSVGLQIDGGQVTLQDIHVENYSTGILDNIRSINNGQITLQGYMAAGGIMTDAIRIDNAATVTPHLALHNIMSNGATNTINDQRTSTLTTGNILTWTYK